MNIAGIGIDAVEISRFDKAANERGEKFLMKIFTMEELSFSEKYKERNVHLAGKFSAKEAVKKSMPCGSEIGLAWPEIEILNHDDGKPYVRLHGKAKEVALLHNVAEIFVSISHSETVAVSNAVAVTHVS
ncbi:MAG: holo-ACP synthase [Candidatus Omnitrophica bacterium]|nr:holo-ACP synthase [Candidatus Omnitrophota bacterium]